MKSYSGAGFVSFQIENERNLIISIHQNKTPKIVGELNYQNFHIDPNFILPSNLENYKFYVLSSEVRLKVDAAKEIIVRSENKHRYGNERSIFISDEHLNQSTLYTIEHLTKIKTNRNKMIFINNSNKFEYILKRNIISIEEIFTINTPLGIIFLNSQIIDDMIIPRELLDQAQILIENYRYTLSRIKPPIVELNLAENTELKPDRLIKTLSEYIFLIHATSYDQKLKDYSKENLNKPLLYLSSIISDIPHIYNLLNNLERFLNLEGSMYFMEKLYLTHISNKKYN